MDDWKHRVITTLAAEPEAWRPLGELFRLVEDDLPLHLVLRRAAGFERIKRRRNGDDRPVVSTDLDLVSAQWTFFTAFALPMIERQTPTKWKRAQRAELVRLKPRDPCPTCAGPTYVMRWVPRGVHLKYECPRCANGEIPQLPPAPPPVVVEVPAPVVIELPKPPPKLTIVPKPEPPPPVILDYGDLGKMSSLREMREVFGSHFPELTDNRKLRWHANRALEAGALNEYIRLQLGRGVEFQALGYLMNPALADGVLTERAMTWIKHKTPGLTRKERTSWALIMTEAFCFGALGVVTITLADRLPVISDELDRLKPKSKHKPKPQHPRAPPKQRWLAGFKKIARFRWGH